MERFFSAQNMDRYRKLLDKFTRGPQRRIILKCLSEQELGIRGELELKVGVELRGDKYVWELRREGHYQPVKFSAPIYASKETARVAGDRVRTLYLARLAARRAA